MEREPNNNHEERFMSKLQARVKKHISLVPYFIRLWIVVFIIYICTVLAWYDIKYHKPSKILKLIERIEK